MASQDIWSKILEHPDDLQLRAVWADSLIAEGNPRGELVALQLAHREGSETYASWAREQALIQTQGPAWVGELGAWFPYERVFEDGMFAGGRVKYNADVQTLPDHPEWPFITCIRGGDHGVPLVTDPRSRIRRFVAVIESKLVEWLGADDLQADLVELGMVVQTDGPTKQHPLGECRGLPKLTTITLAGENARIAAALKNAPVIERLELLRLEEVHRGATDNSALFINTLVPRGGTLRTVEARLRDRRDPGWRVRLCRDNAPGPFTRIVAWHWGPRAPKDLAEDCLSIFRLVDLATIRTIDIELGRAARMPPTVVAQLNTALEGARKLEHCNVPWPSAQTTSKPRAKTVERFKARFDSVGIFDALPKVRECFHDDLGLALDCYSVNDRGTPKLTAKVLPKLATLGAAPSTKTIALRQKGTGDQVILHQWETVTPIEASFATSLPVGPLADWFLRALTLLSSGPASLSLDSARYRWNAFYLEGYEAPYPGWLVALPNSFRRALDEPAMARLAPLMEVRPCESHVVFKLGDQPTDATPDKVRQAAAAIVREVDAWAAPRAPVWFERMVRKELVPAGERGGANLLGAGPLRFAWKLPDGGQLLVRLNGALTDEWHLYITVEGPTSQTLAYEENIVEDVAAELISQAAPWLAGP